MHVSLRLLLELLIKRKWFCRYTLCVGSKRRVAINIKLTSSLWWADQQWYMRQFNTLKTEKKILVFRDYSLSNDYQIFTHISASGIFTDAFTDSRSSLAHGPASSYIAIADCTFNCPHLKSEKRLLTRNCYFFHFPPASAELRWRKYFVDGQPYKNAPARWSQFADLCYRTASVSQSKTDRHRSPYINNL